MKIGNMEYDHIEVFDETGRLITSISDDEISKEKNCTVNLCETDEMFEKMDEFEQACRPLMKYMAENHHPHTITVVSSNKVELLEGNKCIYDDKYLVD